MPKSCATSFHIDHYEKPFSKSFKGHFYSPKNYSSKKIFVSNWHKFRLEEPKDRDPCGDQTSFFLSTYDRGSESEEPWISETTSMLEQIKNKDKYERHDPTPMFNMVSYSMSESPKKRAALKMLDIVEHPPPYELMDFETEKSSSFINYFPHMTRKKEVKEETEMDFFQFHKSLSEFTDAASYKRSGWNKFQDDNRNDFYRFSRFKKIR